MAGHGDKFLDKYTILVKSDGTLTCDFVQGSVYYRFFPIGMTVTYPDGRTESAYAALFDREGNNPICGQNYAELEREIHGRDLTEQTIH